MTDKESEKKETKNINWKDIVVDTKTKKFVDVPWSGANLRIYYKDLVGEEGLNIELKYPSQNELTKVYYEKTYAMIAKANADLDDDGAKLTRDDWNNLPERLKNKIVSEIFEFAKVMQENFQNTLGQT